MPQTRVKTNHEPYQEPNGTNRKEHTTVGIPRGCFDPQGKRSSQKTRTLYQTGDGCFKRNEPKTTFKSQKRWEGRQHLNPEREPTTNTLKSQMEQIDRNTQRLGSFEACLEPQRKRSSQKARRLTQTGNGRLYRKEPKTTLRNQKRWKGRQRLNPERETTTNTVKSQMEQMERNTQRSGHTGRVSNRKGKGVAKRRADSRRLETAA